MAEVAGVRKAAFHRDFPERVAAHAHEVLSPLDAHANHILPRSAAETGSERAFESAAAEFRNPGEVRHFDLCLQMDGYIAPDAARLPRLHEIVALVRASVDRAVHVYRDLSMGIEAVLARLDDPSPVASGDQLIADRLELRVVHEYDLPRIVAREAFVIVQESQVEEKANGLRVVLVRVVGSRHAGAVLRSRSCGVLCCVL